MTSTFRLCYPIKAHRFNYFYLTPKNPDFPKLFERMVHVAVRFDGKRLFKTLVLNEAKVAEFYNTLASEMKEGKGRNLFERMAKEELRHEKIYAALMDKLPNEGSLELDEEDAEYMNALIQNNMFEDAEDTVAKVRGKYAKDDALTIAEKIERDGLIFVGELMRLYPEVAPDEIKVVMAEERKHLKSVLQARMDFASDVLML